MKIHFVKASILYLSMAISAANFTVIDTAVYLRMKRKFGRTEIWEIK
tara:strand:+ start:1415 stop:1555 length:141 start_codon:yes stop_codon:yes gene_type:complete